MPLLADGLLPTSSMLSLHLLLGLPLTRFPSLGIHSDVILAHLVLLILATCPAHCPLMHRTLSVISFTPVLHLIISFRILSLFVMFNNNPTILRWATASFLSWCFVRAHVSAPWVIAGKMTVSMIVLFRKIGILLSFKKWLYSPNLLHPDVILWAISLLMSLPYVTNLPKYLYSVTSSNCSPSIIIPVLSLLLAT